MANAPQWMGGAGGVQKKASIPHSGSEGALYCPGGADVPRDGRPASPSAANLVGALKAEGEKSGIHSGAFFALAAAREMLSTSV